MMTLIFLFGFVTLSAAALQNTADYEIQIDVHAPHLDTQFELISCTTNNFDTLHVPNKLHDGTHKFAGAVLLHNTSIGGHFIEVEKFSMVCRWHLQKDHAVVFSFGFDSECVVGGLCLSAGYTLSQPDPYNNWRWIPSAQNLGFRGHVKLIGTP
jgi:hypothetical protein